jgi:signal transduction histidine kinase
MRISEKWLGDGLLVALVAAIGLVVTTFLDKTSTVDREVDALAMILVAGAALPLIVRRRRPLITLAAATACVTAYLIIGYPYGPILLSFLVAVYTVATYLPLRQSAPAVFAALLVLLSHVLTHEAALGGVTGLIPGSAWAVIPFAIGVTVRQTREATARARAEALREQVYDERLRIAQEVHDVVGHGLAAIKMQADIALHLLAKKPDQAEVALTAISRTSTDALAELRATLAVVRREEQKEIRTENAGLDRLEDLRQRMGEAGVEVSLHTNGSPNGIPAAVGLAGYRVVQESLTNVLRHSAARVASVDVGYETDAVLITVSNPAASASIREGGSGIPGMRNRVTSLGGDFTAGPTSDGRFEVRARIPLGGRS